MKKELAFFKMEAVSDWNGYTRIMSNYLLQSAVPILFNDLLFRCYRIRNNQSFDSYKITDPVKRVNNNYYHEDPDLKGKSPWKENNAHQAVWTTILQEQLAIFSKLRLLGNQSEDMKAYHCNSYNYIRLMGKIFLHKELPAFQEDIKSEFLEMLKDYLLRNVPGLPENASQLSKVKLFTRCETLYEDYKEYTNQKTGKSSTNMYYIDFTKGRYAHLLLEQLKNIARQTDGQEKNNPLLNCYLGNLEYLYTFILYVYMVEYLLCYSPASTAHQKKFNLFQSLHSIDYNSYYKNYIDLLKKKQNM